MYAFVYEMMSRLITKGIIRSYIKRRRGRISAVKPICIVSNCDVCGGLMFNAQRYMHMNDAYLAPSTIRFPYELKKIFDRILHELQYFDKVHSHWIWTSWIGYPSSALIRAVATPFPLPV